MPRFGHFPRPGKIDPYGNNTFQKEASSSEARNLSRDDLTLHLTLSVTSWRASLQLDTFIPLLRRTIMFEVDVTRNCRRRPFPAWEVVLTRLYKKEAVLLLTFSLDHRAINKGNDYSYEYMLYRVIFEHRRCSSILQQSKGYDQFVPSDRVTE